MRQNELEDPESQIPRLICGSMKTDHKSFS